MKFLTLNAHCFAEDDIPRNQQIIADFIKRKEIDVVFLQEVAQSESAPIVKDVIKEDNYGYVIQQVLREKGHRYYYHYMYGNQAFGYVQEGLGILSKTPLFDVNSFYISKKTTYKDWHTRVIVSAKTLYQHKEFTLCSAHIGWTEGEEVFEYQIDRLHTTLQAEHILIGGDFNVGFGAKGYHYVVDKGYYDLFYSGDAKYALSPTHVSDMDIHSGENRIDYIFSNHPYKVIERDIVFKKETVSDHYGVYIEIEVK